ncbi:helix-turn-helix domain-containing protein [Streptomyces poonensis]|uniref:DNA-binding protein n=1 Tax=Streptomyces poonensis TaxID=68255 RepID=A0A918PIU2_9ACTN|nr:helix-turn-helix domain-containing protein [Streptomyces poonensis]GGZ10433.1 DNA-binding protein [Streptomyces poonensis]GLJ91372.1 DNA-binding protein [Streptomyces poonensis]
MAARHPEQFTVVGNHLAQHPEMSLTAIGLATHIQSLPEGTPVGIKALAAKFPEGETRIAAALRELETYGYLARTRERMPSGQIVTRTISYNQPRLNPAFTGTPVPAAPRSETAPEPEEPEPAAPTHSVTPTATTPTATPTAETPTPSAPDRTERTTPTGHLPLLPAPAADSFHHSAAIALLARLRLDDPRLLLSERDIHRLAPAVNAWLERGVDSADVRRTLSASLPVEPLRHPTAFLAHRLTALLPPPLPAAAPRSSDLPNLPNLPDLPRPSRPAPFQTCDGRERAFRSTEPGHCRDCAPRFAAA